MKSNLKKILLTSTVFTCLNASFNLVFAAATDIRDRETTADGNYHSHHKEHYIDKIAINPLMETIQKQQQAHRATLQADVKLMLDALGTDLIDADAAKAAAWEAADAAFYVTTNDATAKAADAAAATAWWNVTAAPAKAADAAKDYDVAAKAYADAAAKAKTKAYAAAADAAAKAHAVAAAAYAAKAAAASFTGIDANALGKLTNIITAALTADADAINDVEDKHDANKAKKNQNEVETAATLQTKANTYETDKDAKSLKTEHEHYRLAYFLMTKLKPWIKENYNNDPIEAETILKDQIPTHYPEWINKKVLEKREDLTLQGGVVVNNPVTVNFPIKITADTLNTAGVYKLGNRTKILNVTFTLEQNGESATVTGLKEYGVYYVEVDGKRYYFKVANQNNDEFIYDPERVVTIESKPNDELIKLANKDSNFMPRLSFSGGNDVMVSLDGGKKWQELSEINANTFIRSTQMVQFKGLDVGEYTFEVASPYPPQRFTTAIASFKILPQIITPTATAANRDYKKGDITATILSFKPEKKVKVKHGKFDTDSAGYGKLVTVYFDSTLSEKDQANYLVIPRAYTIANIKAVEVVAPEPTQQPTTTGGGVDVPGGNYVPGAGTTEGGGITVNEAFDNIRTSDGGVGNVNFQISGNVSEGDLITLNNGSDTYEVSIEEDNLFVSIPTTAIITAFEDAVSSEIDKVELEFTNKSNDAFDSYDIPIKSSEMTEDETTVRFLDLTANDPYIVSVVGEDGKFVSQNDTLTADTSGNLDYYISGMEPGTYYSFISKAGGIFGIGKFTVPATTSQPGITIIGGSSFEAKNIELSGEYLVFNTNGAEGQTVSISTVGGNPVTSPTVITTDELDTSSAVGYRIEELLDGEDPVLGVGAYTLTVTNTSIDETDTLPLEVVGATFDSSTKMLTITTAPASAGAIGNGAFDVEIIYPNGDLKELQAQTMNKTNPGVQSAIELTERYVANDTYYIVIKDSHNNVVGIGKFTV